MLYQKILLSIYMRNYQQLNDAKNHILGSLRELLMAASVAVDIVNKSTPQNTLLNKVLPLKNSIKNIDELLKFALNKVKTQQNLPESFDLPQIKHQVLESIIGVIDEEIDTISRNPHAKNQLKIEALETVKKTLFKHLDTSNQSYFAEFSDEISQAVNS